MDQTTLTTIATTVSGLLGGAYGGFRVGKSSSLQDATNSTQIANDTVQMLQAQIDHLEEVKDEQLQVNADLRARVGVLEELVTQRAAVGEVHDDVKAMSVVVNRIAGKVGA